MKNYDWVMPVFVLGIFILVICGTLSWDGGREYGRNQGIVFCMEQPEKCNVEYQYIKLKQGDIK
jgi:hypothetical protein